MGRGDGLNGQGLPFGTTAPGLVEPLASHEALADPHTGYVLESAHTLPAHDTLGLATQAELDALSAAYVAQADVFDARYTAKPGLQRASFGNGLSKPLSTFYATLAEAQVDYPQVTALTQQLDWAVLEKTSADVAALPYGGVVNVGPGKFYTTDIWNATQSSDTTVRGAGRESTIIDYRGAGGYALHFGNKDYTAGGTNYRGLRLEDIQVIGLNSSGDAGGVKVFGATRWSMARIYIKQFAGSWGLGLIDYGWIGSLYDPRIEDCKYAVKADVGSLNGSNQAANGITIVGGEVGAGCTYGVVIGEETAVAVDSPVVGSSVVIIGTVIEGVDEWAVWFVHGDAHRVIGCYFEANGVVANTGHVRVGNGNPGVRPRSITVAESFFSGAMAAGSVAVQIDRVEHAWMQHNHYSVDCTSGSTTAVKITSAQAENVRLGPDLMSATIDTRYDTAAGDTVLIDEEKVAGYGQSLRLESGRVRWQADGLDLFNVVGTQFLKIQDGVPTLILAPSSGVGDVLEIRSGGLAGTLVAAITSSGIGRFAAGTLAAPGIAFEADDNTGLFNIVADQMVVAVGGVNAMQVLTSKIVPKVNLSMGIDGTVGFPALARDTDTNTGLYFPAVDTVGLVIGGVEGLRVSAPADGEVAVLVRRNVGGVFSSQRVSMGVDDSGGVGFKLLRVPN